MKPISAYTTYPNTPESDKQQLVMHTITFDNGLKTKLMAECPIDALERVREAIERQQTMIIEV